MATAGNVGGLLLGLLAGLGQAIHQRRLEGQTGQTQRMALLKDSGEFLQATPEESSQAQAGLGLLDRFMGRTPPGFFNVGDQLLRFEPAQPLPFDVAKSLGFTTQVPREVQEPSLFSSLQQRMATPALTGQVDPGLATLPSSGFTPESFAQAFEPTTRTVLEEQVMPGLGKFTSKQRQALLLEAAKERHKTGQEERARIKSLKTTLLNDWRQRKIPIPNEFLRKLLEANTESTLAQVIANAPTQLTVKVTYKGQEHDLPLSEAIQLDRLQQGERRLEQMGEQIGLSNQRLDTALGHLTSRNRQQELSNFTIYQRSAAKELGVDLTDPSQQTSETLGKVNRKAAEIRAMESGEMAMARPLTPEGATQTGQPLGTTMGEVRGQQIVPKPAPSASERKEISDLTEQGMRIDELLTGLTPAIEGILGPKLTNPIGAGQRIAGSVVGSALNKEQRKYLAKMSDYNQRLKRYLIGSQRTIPELRDLADLIPEVNDPVEKIIANYEEIRHGMNLALQARGQTLGGLGLRTPPAPPAGTPRQTPKPKTAKELLDTFEVTP